FAKLGQVLSTRPDLLPKQIIDELATLQEKVPPLTEEQVVEGMERDLGVAWVGVGGGFRSHRSPSDRCRYDRPGASRHAGIRRARRREGSTPDGAARHRARSRTAGTAGPQVCRAAGIAA